MFDKVPEQENIIDYVKRNPNIKIKIINPKFVFIDKIEDTKPDFYLVQVGYFYSPQGEPMVIYGYAIRAFEEVFGIKQEVLKIDRIFYDENKFGKLPLDQ